LFEVLIVGRDFYLLNKLQSGKMISDQI